MRASSSQGDAALSLSPTVDLRSETKLCSRCGHVKPLEDFAVDRSKRIGRKPWCRECDNQRSREYYKANAEKIIARTSARRRTQSSPRICRRCGRRETMGPRFALCDPCRADRPRWKKARKRPPGNTTASGYGKPHQQLRARWAKRVATGTVRCWRCGHLIAPGTRWDLGHDDEDRRVYRGPEHAGCNRGAANRRRAGRVVMVQRTSREW
jgi:hypothetical protein